MIIQNNEKDFYKLALDAKNRALQGNAKLFRFLSPRQIEILKYVIGNSCHVAAYGGYDDAEYCRCLVSPYEIDINDLKISILEIKYNKRYLKLNHRAVLGAMLSLGINRDTVGDIIIGDQSYIITSFEIKDFLINEYTSLSGQPINLVEVEELNISTENREEKTIFVSSLRLDTVISKGINISREHSQELIRDEKVKVNYTVMQNYIYECRNNDIFSIRGYGRIKIIEIGGTTKSGNICLTIIVY